VSRAATAPRAGLLCDPSRGPRVNTLTRPPTHGPTARDASPATVASWSAYGGGGVATRAPVHKSHACWSAAKREAKR
jgi:hypothetical protein